MPPDELSKVALITGGGSGIGRAVARRLFADGLRVAVAGRTAAKLDGTIDGMDLDAACVLTADLSDPVSARRVVDDAVQRFGRLDVLVNAHGILGATKRLAELTDEDILEAVSTNLLGPIAITRAAAPHLAKARGAVVNVVTVNALQAEPYAVPYGVSKTGLMGFTRYAAVELADQGVRVNSVLPGWVATPMTQELLEDVSLNGQIFSANLLKRPAEPDEIAAVIAFLASEQASFMTGASVVADGGQTIHLAPLSAGSD